MTNNPKTLQTTILSDHQSLVRKVKGTVLSRLLVRLRRLHRDPKRAILNRMGQNLPYDWHTEFLEFPKWPDEVRARLNMVPEGFVTEYSLKSSSAFFLYQWIRKNRPRAILECGCGISTIVMALALSQTLCEHCCKIVSLETEEKWRSRTILALRSVGLMDMVDLRLVPFLEVNFGGHRFFSPSTEHLEDLNAEFFFIDSPIIDVGRHGTLLAAYQALSPSAMVVLDDAWREEEFQCVEMWTTEGLVRLIGFVPVGQGLALLEVLKESSSN